MLDYILKLLTESEHMEDAGSFYDEARIIQFTAVTPSSETVLYKLRRRQDHAHPKPWDYKLAVIVNGKLAQTIGIPY
jgi:hypothetical protein